MSSIRQNTVFMSAHTIHMIGIIIVINKTVCFMNTVRRKFSFKTITEMHFRLETELLSRDSRGVPLLDVNLGQKHILF